MMKSYSIHFVLGKGSDYKDLAPAFPDILKIILQENDHFQDEKEDEESREMFIELNMADLELNRKPEGYNRKGKYRLIFPMDRKEFYVKTVSGKANDIKRIGGQIEDILSTANVKFEISYDDDLDFN